MRMDNKGPKPLVKFMPFVHTPLLTTRVGARHHLTFLLMGFRILKARALAIAYPHNSR